MTARIADLHIAAAQALPEPQQLRDELPASPAHAAFIAEAREQVRAVVRGDDDRLLVDHRPLFDPRSDVGTQIRPAPACRGVAAGRRAAARDARLLRKAAHPMGWKGLINDPTLDGHGDIGDGLRIARRLLLECAGSGVPTASEILDPVTPQYIAELLAWGAIGARTVESPLHRQMASALSAPVGFKNATDGSVAAAVDAIVVAAASRTVSRPSRCRARRWSITTTGNPDGHLVLRGGADRPNFDAASVERAVQELAASGLPPRVVIDCSHGNSAKDWRRQPLVAADVAGQIAQGQHGICGVMLESHLVEGRQDIDDGANGLQYGLSVTDGCIGWRGHRGGARHAGRSGAGAAPALTGRARRRPRSGADGNQPASSTITGAWSLGPFVLARRLVDRAGA